jgi:hypothetical protein
VSQPTSSAPTASPTPVSTEQLAVAAQRVLLPRVPCKLLWSPRKPWRVTTKLSERQVAELFEARMTGKANLMRQASDYFRKARWQVQRNTISGDIIATCTPTGPVSVGFGNSKQYLDVSGDTFICQTDRPTAEGPTETTIGVGQYTMLWAFYAYPATVYSFDVVKAIKRADRDAQIKYPWSPVRMVVIAAIALLVLISASSGNGSAGSSSQAVNAPAPGEVASADQPGVPSTPPSGAQGTSPSGDAQGTSSSGAQSTSTSSGQSTSPSNTQGVSPTGGQSTSTSSGQSASPSGGQSAAESGSADESTTTAAVGTAGEGTEELPAQPSTEPVVLAKQVDRAEEVIHDTSSSPSELAAAGRLEQLATRELFKGGSSLRSETFDNVSGDARASLLAAVGAAQALKSIVPAQKSLPKWRIVEPPPPDTLLSYFRAAEQRVGVPWEYLAAIQFVETRMGRIRGTSTAGAQGPMQFIPATWARYGHGSVNSYPDSIMAAARLLVTDGAPSDMGAALYHYNPSPEYVHAVTRYAEHMREDERAFYGYYYWQVTYKQVGGTVILPAGYPKVPAEPVE